jgi:prepilin-type N-terminal cleavage/methylation domain-containing protein
MVSRFHPRTASERGFSMIEMLMVVAIIGVLAAITVPMSGNSIRYFKLSGDARELANAAAVAKMRAAARFTQSRLYTDLGGKTFYLQTFIRMAPAPTGCTVGQWCTDGGAVQLSSSVSFGYGVVPTPPLNTQSPSITQAPMCKDNSSPPVDVPGTACIVFNSRGIPVDETGSPTGNDALYINDGTSVYGITAAATGFIRTWQSRYSSIPTWTLQ